MKSILSVFAVFLILLAFVGDSTLFAQDSTRTQSKQKFKHQIKHQKGEQVKVKKGKDIVKEEEEETKNDLIEDQAVKTRKNEDQNSQGAKTRTENKQAGFKDDDGDGVNDNALDEDGDGIPNGQDPDYTKSKDGKTHQKIKNKEIKKQNMKTKSKSIQNK